MRSDLRAERPPCESPDYRYGEWRGNPRGVSQNPAKCVVQVWPSDRGMIPYQCRRRRGYGLNGLYCKQHAYRSPAVPA